MGRTLVVLGAGMLLAACAHDQPSPQQPNPLGNILMIIADDLGIDHLGAYGVGANPLPTPTIDALAD